MDESVKSMDFSEEFYIDRALERYDESDWIGVLKLLGERAERYEPSADSTSMYAEAYDELGLYRLSVKAWFRFLDTCDEDDMYIGYRAVANSLIHLGEQMGNPCSQDAFRRALTELKAQIDNNLRLVHSDDGDDAEFLFRDATECLQKGENEEAREYLSQIKPGTDNYSYASALTSLSYVLDKKPDEAIAECERVLKEDPDNLYALTTYCAVLSVAKRMEQAQKIGMKIAEMSTDNGPENLRAGMALGECGLHEDAYKRFCLLKKREPYGMESLFFHAVSCYHTGRLEEAIESLEMLTLINPEKVIAEYYLERMRIKRDDEPELDVGIGYSYKMPGEVRDKIQALFKAIMDSDEEDLRLGEDPEVLRAFFFALDNLDGRDTTLVELATKAAVKCRADKALRAFLLDPFAEVDLKFDLLELLTMRNEENSFGVVLFNLYHEYFTAELELNLGHEKEFLAAFSAAYSKFYLFDEESEEKLLNAGETVYEGVIEHDKSYLFSNIGEMCVAIYREARLNEERIPIEDLSKGFGANADIVKEILDCVL